MTRHDRPPARWPKLLVDALFVVASAAAAYRITRPVYQSRGRISKIVVTGSNVPWPPNFIETQSSIIQSTRVIDAALSMPIWKSTADHRSARSFARDMEIHREGGRIQLHFRDTDPARADAAIRAICDGYSAVNQAIRQESLPKLLDLTNRKRELIGQIGEIDHDIRAAADECGAADLSLLREAVSKKIGVLERALRDGIADDSEAFRRDLNVQKATLSKIDQSISAILALQAKRNKLFDELKPLESRASQIEIANQFHPGFSFEPAASPVTDNRRSDAALAAFVASLSVLSSWIIAKRYRQQRQALQARSSFPVIIATSHPPFPHASDV